MMLKNIITFTLLLLVVSAIGLLFFPAKMLAVVGIASNAQTDFLLRVSSVGVASLIPGAWTVRNAPPSPISRAVLMGLAVYMFLSSIVDLQAYTQSIVGAPAVPSIIFRTVLGIAIVWIVMKEKTTLK